MDGFPSGQRGQTVNLLAMPSKVRILLHPFDEYNSSVVASGYAPMWLNWQSSWFVISRLSVRVRSSALVSKEYIAGWSSLEARRAHNPKVIGSNPVPATLFLKRPDSSVGRAEDWKSSCHWFDSGHQHLKKCFGLFYRRVRGIFICNFPKTGQPVEKSA